MQQGVPRKLSAPSAAFLFLMTIGYAVYAVDRTVLSAVLAPMRSSLNLTNVQVGYLGAAQYIGVLAVVQLAGSLSDVYGRRRIILLGLLVFSSFTWLMGTATSFYEAFGYRLVSGVGEGLFWPVAMSAVAGYFGGRRGLAMGIFYVGFDAGSVAGLSIGGFSYYLTGGWRYAFFAAPLLGIIPLAGAFAMRGAFGRAAEVKRAGFLRADAAALLRERRVQLVMLFALLATWASVWQTVFLPYYFATAMHYTVLSAALLSSAVTVAGALGKVALGGISDFFSRTRAMALISAAVSLVYVGFFLTAGFLLSLSLALLMGFLSASIFPILQSEVSELSGGRVGTALGLTTTSQSVATVFSTLIAGYLFYLGVGKALALDAIVPALLMTVVGAALALSARTQGGPRPSRPAGAPATGESGAMEFNTREPG